MIDNNVLSSVTPSDFKTCSKIDDNCEVRFIVSTLVVGDEDPLYVVIDPNQSDLRTLMSDPGLCIATPTPWSLYLANPSS